MNKNNCEIEENDWKENLREDKYESNNESHSCTSEDELYFNVNLFPEIERDIFKNILFMYENHQLTLK